MDKTLKRSSVSGQLVALLQRQMVQGDIRPGAKLASQRAMQQQFQLSRTSVREAMAELQNVGLVETHHGGGSFCCNLLDPFFQNDSGDLPGLGHSLPVQVLEMREVLEGEAAYYCALRASDAERQLIAQEYEQMSAGAAQETSLSPAKTLRKAKADLTFHMLIADSCHHLLVLSISQILYSRYFNAIYSVLSQTFKKQGRYPQQIGTQHRDICQAICQGDAETARTAARQHIAYTRGLLLS